MLFDIVHGAEASVGTGGLETAVNNACGIRILFNPSLTEARYLWNSEALEVMREQQYSAGDAWFSADDGITGGYVALSELLSVYYNDADTHSVMSEAKERCAVSASDLDKTR